MLVSSLVITPGKTLRQGVPSWIFIHDTDKVEGGLMVLIFGLVFSVGPPGNFFLPTPLNLIPVFSIHGGFWTKQCTRRDGPA